MREGGRAKAHSLSNGVINKMPFVKGYKPTEEHRKNLSRARKGKKLTEEHKKKLSEAHKGNPGFWTGKERDKETKEKISNKLKGLTPWNKGRKCPKTSDIKHWNYKDGRSKNKEHVSWVSNRRNRVIKRLKEQGSSHTFGEWELLKKQYGYMCPCCKKTEPDIKLTEDHIIPLSKGGSDYIENIQPLCMHCNAVKHTKIIKY